MPSLDNAFLKMDACDGSRFADIPSPARTRSTMEGSTMDSIALEELERTLARLMDDSDGPTESTTESIHSITAAQWLGPEPLKPTAKVAPPPGLQNYDSEMDRQAISVSDLEQKLLRAAQSDSIILDYPASYSEQCWQNADHGEDSSWSYHTNNWSGNVGNQTYDSSWRATVMLRNIPNKYTADMLVDRLQQGGYKGSIDFIYLPIDFKNKCNVGYAFVNFREQFAKSIFEKEFNNKPSADVLPGFRSKKVCEVAPAAHQGFDVNVRRLQGSPVMAQLVQHPDWLPRIFDETGEAVEFPTLDQAPPVRKERVGGFSRRAYGGAYQDTRPSVRCR